MKRSFTAALCFFISTGALAQTKNIPVFPLQNYKLEIPSSKWKLKPSMEPKIPLLNMAKKDAQKAILLSTSPKGKVYTLPQDNMPCLVPDMSEVSLIPNKGNTPGSVPIPNSLILQQNLIPGNK